MWASLIGAVGALLVASAFSVPLGRDPVPPAPKVSAHNRKPAKKTKKPASPPPMPAPLLPSHRIVAFYGNPLDARMGVLGQGTSQQMLGRLAQQAQAYQALDPSHPVIEALELVAVVAQGTPGPNGTYRLRMPPSLIESELKLARSAHALLILDVQVGHSPVAAEVKYLEPFLKQPDVELALDPEFDMNHIPGGIPGKEFGSMTATAINGAIDVLHQLVVQDHLPPKILIVHQFLPQMVPDWKNIHPLPGVSFIMDTDGFGTPALKTANYHSFITNQPIGYGGIKLFYTQDTPLMSPAQVLALQPPPLLIIYQ
ncbi:hypothetical protein [Sulfobacillus harzensis]|uniref:Lipoprotein n=1 Tax=Sulfobacillus harzensis TaxID=2729629 RepID=A0A7Y0L9I7_9FIRM|nr:hypothetical protein [Sulfobacillus harzensis]NMP24990.1 hypothetical protein [Sulfobacillus harzensis]